MTQTKQVKNAPELYGLTVYDRSAWLLFDWLTEPAGMLTEAEYRLFSEPLSVTKGLARTNMHMAGLLPVPSGFLVNSLHCYYGNMTDQDKEAFREKYMVQFVVLQKTMYESPLLAIPDKGLILPAWKDLPEDWPVQPGDFSETPQYLLPSMFFMVRLVGEPFGLRRNGNGLKFLPVLQGKMDRAVC